MRKADRISGVFWLIFSLVVIEEAYRLGLGTLHSPEAGFLPFLASVTLGTLSLLLLWSTRSRKAKITKKGDEISFNRQRIPKMLFVAATLFIYALMLNTLGFILCTMGLIGFLLRVVEPEKWHVVITATISVPLISYLLFDVWLRVQLPKGFLGF